jgi:hypothetical protein
MQRRQQVVSGIIVLVEAEISLFRGIHATRPALPRSRCRPAQACQDEPQQERGCGRTRLQSAPPPVEVETVLVPVPVRELASCRAVLCRYL